MPSVALICFGSWGLKRLYIGWLQLLVHILWKLSQINYRILTGMAFDFMILIFPLFLFMAGVATPYSVGRELEKGKDKQQLLLRVIRRGIVLVLLGIVYNNGLSIQPISEMRFGSVLGRIGLAYMFANILYLYTIQRGQIIWFCSLLIGYWLFAIV